MDILKRIVDLRKERNWTEYQLAELANEHLLAEQQVDGDHHAQEEIEGKGGDHDSHPDDGVCRRPQGGHDRLQDAFPA